MSGKHHFQKNNESTLDEQGALPISKTVFAKVAYYISLMKIPNIQENRKGFDMKLCLAQDLPNLVGHLMLSFHYVLINTLRALLFIPHTFWEAVCIIISERQ